MPNPIQAKQLATGVAPTSVDIGDAAAEGVSESVARADHVHAVAAPAAPADVTKAAAATGSATEAARADHKHDVTTGAPPAATGAANAEGTATTLARSDHEHAINDLLMTSQAQGTILQFDGTNWVVLPVGTAGQLLQTNGAGADATWVTLGSSQATWKDSCELATSAADGDISLAAAPATIDGTAPTAGARILVKNQTLGQNNGIYIWTAAAAIMNRATDADTDAEVNCGMTVYVCEGSVNADSVWSLTTDDPITVGTTVLAFANTSAPVGTAQGDVAFWDSERWTLLAPGTAGEFLQTGGTGADPAWAAQDGGTPNQERVTTQTINNSDTALTDTLNNTPISDASLSLYLNGVQQIQGVGEDYTISGVTITWLASSGTAVNMSTNDDLVALYES